MTSPPALHPEAAAGLAMALIASSTAPVLLLDGDLLVRAASDTFCKAFGVDASCFGRRINLIGRGEWAAPQLESLLRSIVSGNEVGAYEMDLARPGQAPRRLVLNARLLDYAGHPDTRVLLTVSDVTDARVADRLREDMQRENAVLLQELQHRVANSLQIVASVLMQSARNVQSAETREHLHDAHSRVMSVATLQNQLATTTPGDVALRAYFQNLCGSIGASMIRDHNQLSLGVTADDTVTTADVSVSLGLIVTELVINALKHAFPNDRRGHIAVDYRAVGASWKLSVADDGVGMAGEADSSPGLGTTIIDALAKKLHADVTVKSAQPGTIVSIEKIDGAPQVEAKAI